GRGVDGGQFPRLRLRQCGAAVGHAEPALLRGHAGREGGRCGAPGAAAAGVPGRREIASLAHSRFHFGNPPPFAGEGFCFDRYSLTPSRVALERIERVAYRNAQETLVAAKLPDEPADASS